MGQMIISIAMATLVFPESRRSNRFGSVLSEISFRTATQGVSIQVKPNAMSACRWTLSARYAGIEGHNRVRPLGVASARVTVDVKAGANF